MSRSVLIMLSVLALFWSVPGPAGAEDYQVTFQTNDCNGDTGVATVVVNRIYKIETMTCDPPYEKNRRKQILIRSKRATTGESGQGVFALERTQPVVVDSFDAMTVTEKEAARIQSEIERYMEAKRKLLEKGNPLILQK